MATKNNPGPFDCYANAGPDEPMFILLGRDALAPSLVRLWAHARLATNQLDAEKVNQAFEVVDAMRQELYARDKPAIDVLDYVPTPDLVAQLVKRGVINPVSITSEEDSALPRLLDDDEETRL